MKKKSFHGFWSSIGLLSFCFSREIEGGPGNEVGVDRGP